MSGDQNTTFSVNDTNIAKGLAICFMLFHHCFLSRDRYEGFDITFFPFSESTVIQIALFGKICVGIFAFLSAYGMMKSCAKIQKDSRRENSRFILRRYVKLITGFWPAYLVCLIGCTLFSASTWSAKTIYGHGIESVVYALMDLLGLSDLFETKTLIGTWWYLSFAIILIVVFPILEAGCRKLGWTFFFICCILPYITGDSSFLEPYLRWIIVAVCGILCAEYHVFERIKNKLILQKKYIYVLICTILCIVWYPAFSLRQLDIYSKMTPLIDSLNVFFAILFCFLVIAEIPYLRGAFSFLGKHSMNIFLIHSFIRAKWFYEFTYSHKSVFLIWFMLLIESLLVSVVLEWLKKITRYNLFCQKIIAKIEGGSRTPVAISAEEMKKENSAKIEIHRDAKT